MPLDDVLGSFRLGGRLVWQAITQQARVNGLVDTDGLLDLGTRLVKKVKAEGRRVTEADLDTLRNICRCATYARIREAYVEGAAGM